ncbi:hypothetical protein BDV10DRAFT_30849 [Aspergillus recurvatus]
MLCAPCPTVFVARLLSSYLPGDRVSNYQGDLARGCYNLDLVGERSCPELTLLVNSQSGSRLGYMQTNSAYCWGSEPTMRVRRFESESGVHYLAGLDPLRETGLTRYGYYDWPACGILDWRDWGLLGGLAASSTTVASSAESAGLASQPMML